MIRFVGLIVLVLVALGLAVRFGPAGGGDRVDSPVPDRVPSRVLPGTPPIPLEIPAIRADPLPAVAEPAREEAPDELDDERNWNALATFGGPPDDPIEKGECALVLRLMDRSSGAFLASSVDLWRLDAPGNSKYTRGDQRQVRGIEVPEEGVRIEELPAGRYRVQCSASRDDAAGPPPFSVAPFETFMTVYIDRPEKRPAWLKIHDERGGLITEAEFRHLGRSGAVRVLERPQWAVGRELKDPGDTIHVGGGVGGGFFGSTSGRRYRTVQAGPGGFALGSFEGNSVSRDRSDRLRFRKDSLCDVSCRVRGRDRENRTYVAVMIEPDPVLRSIRLPDGTTAALFAEHVSIESGSLLEAEAKTNAPWTEVPISVRIRHPGYQEVRFNFRLMDGQLAVRILEPAEDESGSF